MPLPQDKDAADERLRRRESWVDAAIRQARDEGAFDDLPGKGQPLRLDDNPFSAEWSTVFGTLKHAGVAPYWIELDKEIRAELDELQTLRERAGRQLADQLAAIRQATSAPRPAQPFFKRLLFGPGQSQRGPRVSPRDLEATRQGQREHYLERAARLDRKITEYNAVLPDDLRWLQRPRLTPARAAAEFDAACPPVGSMPAAPSDTGGSLANT